MAYPGILAPYCDLREGAAASAHAQGMIQPDHALNFVGGLPGAFQPGRQKCLLCGEYFKVTAGVTAWRQRRRAGHLAQDCKEPDDQGLQPPALRIGRRPLPILPPLPVSLVCHYVQIFIVGSFHDAVYLRSV